ncbi:MAG: M23 family metallopeptidase [Deltaproteobacteria bacterium]|nr:MAG: M23 family metallopeptidase [Deltaproteobacteria bacterium]
MKVVRFRTLLSVLLITLLGCFTGLSAEAPSGEFSLIIDLKPEVFAPGQVVVVTVTGEQRIEKVSGRFQGRDVFFQRSGNANEYQALLGIGLFTKPGEYRLEIKTDFHDVPTRRMYRSISVTDKVFALQRLTLPPELVTLSEKDLLRVGREKVRLDKIWRKETPERLWKGGFIKPVEGEWGSEFGLRRIINDEPRSPHTGVDITAPEGSPIRATNSGRVVLTDDLFFSGNSLVIDHGQGLYTMYFHLSKFIAKEGQKVKKGEIIGLVGSTGRASGPHLHWGVRLQETRVDPVSLISLSLR